MANWTGTKTNMTVDGDTNLRLDAGATYGQYERTKVDLAYLGYWTLILEFEMQEDPASDDATTRKIEIDTSADDIVWAGWKPFAPGEYLLRYYKLRLTVWGEPAIGQRPKFTRCEIQGAPTKAHPRILEVQGMQNNPPAAATAGEWWIVDTGGGAWAGQDGNLTYCQESTGPTYLFVDPVQGQIVHRVDVNEDWGQDENGEWNIWDPRTLHGSPIILHANDWDAIVAGVWNLTIDVGQYHNGFRENYSGAAQADLDEIEWDGVCLARGTYVLNVHTQEDVGFAIIDIDIKRGAGAYATKATFDCYAAGPAKNIRKQQAAIAVTYAGLYKLRVKVHGRNGLAVDWKAAIELIVLYRTA